MKKLKIKDLKKKFMHVAGGEVLTEDIFLKNIRFIFLVIVIIALYISNRYSCIEKIAEIESLQKELKDAKYESLTISTQLEGISREAKVKSLLDRNGVVLEKPKDAIYKLK